MAAGIIARAHGRSRRARLQGQGGNDTVNDKGDPISDAKDVVYGTNGNE